MEDDDRSVHRLEASSPQTGGLFIPSKNKKPSIESLPKASLLGLDKLAQRLKQENNRLSFKSGEDDETIDDFKKKKESSTVVSEHVFAAPAPKGPTRNYREPRIETPTYTGGVNVEAKEKARERERRGDRKGIHASSNKNRDRDRDRKRRDRYDDDRDRSRKSSRRDRNRDSSRRSRHNDEYEPKTPRHKHSSSNWEWDDDKPSGSSEKSSWDFPTPKNYNRKDDDKSHRSTSRYYEDTPRATPGYR